jgi:hypothetical protein
LLRGLCDGISQPKQGRGRPRLPLSDVVFSAVMKIFTTVSGRRATGDLRECESKGHIAHAPHYNSIFNYLENPALTPILKALIEESATPLKAVESDFAVDSSGFATCTYDRWGKSGGNPGNPGQRPLPPISLGGGGKGTYLGQTGFPNEPAFCENVSATISLRNPVPTLPCCTYPAANRDALSFDSPLPTTCIPNRSSFAAASTQRW